MRLQEYTGAIFGSRADVWRGMSASVAYSYVVA